jgi:hypothetical protein
MAPFAKQAFAILRDWDTLPGDGKKRWRDGPLPSRDKVQPTSTNL